MVSPIYPGGMRLTNGVTPRGKVSGAARARVSDQRYDQVQFSSRISEIERQMKETVSQISQAVRTRPARQELDSLRQQVANGAYRADAREIAAKMLLREDG